MKGDMIGVGGPRHEAATSHDAERTATVDRPGEAPRRITADGGWPDDAWDRFQGGSSLMCGWTRRQ